jgi:hypothetical protein
MKRLWRLNLCLVIPAALAACGGPEITPCDLPVAPYALYVIVRDSVTNQPRAIGTAGTADAPGVHDTLVAFPPDSLTLYSKQNVPGTYTVRLWCDGYADWVTNGVEVVWGRCGGGHVRVVARLQPLTP